MKIKIHKRFDSRRDNNLILGDARSVLPKIPDEFSHHCITDPPYNISGYDNKKKIGWLISNDYWKKEKRFSKIDEKWDSFSNDNYIIFTELWLKEVFRIVKPNGNIIIFGGRHNIHQIGDILQRENKKIVNTITWFKRNAFPNITQRMLCESTEYIIWCVNNSQKKAKKWVFNYDVLKKMNIKKHCRNCKKVFSSEYTVCPICGVNNFEVKNVQMRNMWDIPITPAVEKKFGKHPSQKPIEVVRRLILGWTNKRENILDPFMGSGTIPLVCRKYNRRFTGIEISPKYCEIAYKRTNSFSNQENLFGEN